MRKRRVPLLTPYQMTSGHTSTRIDPVIVTRYFSSYENVVKKITRNWHLQLVGSLLGLGYLSDRTLASALADFLHVPEHSITVVVPILLTYWFVQFGYLLFQYIELRLAIDKHILPAYAGPPLTNEDVSHLSHGHCVFDIPYRLEKHATAHKDVIPMCMLSLVLPAFTGLNHAISIYFIFNALLLPLWLSSAIIALVILLLAACYWQFVGNLPKDSLYKWFGLGSFIACLLWLLALSESLPRAAVTS